MYKRTLCQVDKSWLKGQIQECVVNEVTGEVVAITSEDGDMADRLAGLMNIYDGLSQDAIDGGWSSVKGLIAYVKHLEEGLKIIADRKEDSRFFTDEQVAEHYLSLKLQMLIGE